MRIGGFYMLARAPVAVPACADFVIKRAIDLLSGFCQSVNLVFN